MKTKEKENIKSTVYKQALQNFEREYLHFLKMPTLENYIHVKNSQKAFNDCHNNCIKKNLQEIVDGIVKTKYKCFAFCEIPKFEEILKLRAERELASTKLINYLKEYELNAKKLGKKLKYDYSDLLTEFIDKLNEVELNTKVDKKFPKASYIKLPAPNNLKLTELKRLKDYEPELNA